MIKVLSAKIDKSNIDKKIRDSKAYSKKALERINQKVITAQRKLINDFENHPITQEIEGGPEAPNKSGVLSGYGNLYSFIGFGEGSTPLAEAKAFMRKRINISVAKKGKRLEFNVKSPSLIDFERVTRMPFEAGNSWMRMLELGMSSFSFYMYKQSRASRSGQGIQIDNALRSAYSRPTPYMSAILKTFRRRLL